MYLAGVPLWVLDVSNPRSPQVAGSYSRSVGCVGGFDIAGIHGYLLRDGLLQVFDLSDPPNLREIGGTIAGGHGVVASGSVVYVAGGASGLLVAPSQCDPAGIEEPIGSAGPASLRVFPNPALRSARIRVALPAPAFGGATVRAAIFDIGGRRVRTLVDGSLDPGSRDLFWDGRDDAGRAVGAGVYTASVATADGRRSARFVIVR